MLPSCTPALPGVLLSPLAVRAQAREIFGRTHGCACITRSVLDHVSQHLSVHLRSFSCSSVDQEASEDQIRLRGEISSFGLASLCPSARPAVSAPGGLPTHEHRVMPVKRSPSRGRASH